MMGSGVLYRVDGLVIGSELEFPELAPLTDDWRAAPDLNVRLARLAPDLQTSATDIPDLLLTAGGILLVVPGAARFEVGSGSDVTIEIADHPDMALLPLFLFLSTIAPVS